MDRAPTLAGHLKALIRNEGPITVARIAAEFFREPDAHLGFLFAGATMGQLLSVPMFLVGFYFVARARRKAASPA